MFKTKELSLITLLVLSTVFTVSASEKKRVKWAPKSSQADVKKAPKQPAEYLPEQNQQLKKAQQANADISVREQQVIQAQQRPDWEQKQAKQSQKQFSDRAERESIPLKQAQEAATKKKKIEKYD